MNFEEEDINENALYVLKINETGQFETNFIEIEKSLLKEVDIESFNKLFDDDNDNKMSNIKELLQFKKKSILDFYEKLNLNHPDLFEDRDYLERLALCSFYMEFRGIHSHAEMGLRLELENDRLYFNKPSNPYGSGRYDYKQLKDYTKQFFDSYLIEKTYKRCKNDVSIKAFSHRRVGWTTYEYKLNDILAVEVITNFGYGRSSYFVITLIYQDIKIIPYSRLVLYYYVNVMELLRHTREYSVVDCSWKLALDFVKDACNDYQDKGSRSFIIKYVINECEKLIELLPNYLITNIFNLSENKDGNFFYEKDKFEKIELKGFDLILFRGEKISGAVDFTESINKLNKITPTKKYIDCIEDCCIKLLPQLSQALSELDIIIPKYENELIIENEFSGMIENKLSKVNSIVEKSEIEKNTIRQLIVEKCNSEDHSIDSALITDLTAKEISIKFPDYDKTILEQKIFKELLSDHQNNCSTIKREIEKHKKFKTQISKYIDNINNFHQILSE
jgi:hypothetical protein